MIKLKFLPARFGDCIWIEYGDDTKRSRILIDGGTGGTRHEINELIAALPEDERDFELVVVTHIDQDHIEGVLRLLEESDTLNFKVRDFWFNGFDHLPKDEDEEDFGAVQGERLSKQIVKHEIPWNIDFSGKSIMAGDDELPTITLPGGMKLTLLSPAVGHLNELKKQWVKEVTAANMIPGSPLVSDSDEDEDDEEDFGGGSIPDIENLVLKDFHEDEAAGNGSSIAFLAEFDDKSMLFCGDAFPSQLFKALDLISPTSKINLDLMKVSHHASSHNTSPKLLEKINCKKYVISTNGSRFKHPKQDTIARIIKKAGPGTQLFFNYKTKFNDVWDIQSLKDSHGYNTVYPNVGEEGLEINL